TTCPAAGTSPTSAVIMTLSLGTLSVTGWSSTSPRETMPTGAISAASSATTRRAYVGPPTTSLGTVQVSVTDSPTLLVLEHVWTSDCSPASNTPLRFQSIHPLTEPGPRHSGFKLRASPGSAERSPGGLEPKASSAGSPANTGTRSVVTAAPRRGAVAVVATPCWRGSETACEELTFSALEEVNTLPEVHPRCPAPATPYEWGASPKSTGSM